MLRIVSFQWRSFLRGKVQKFAIYLYCLRAVTTVTVKRAMMTAGKNQFVILVLHHGKAFNPLNLVPAVPIT